MLKRAWSRHGALVALYGFILVVLVIITWVGWLDVAEYQHRYAENRAHAADYDATHSSRVILDRCINVAGHLDTLACVIKETRAYQNESYTYYDLKAQQDMAVWAYGMLLVSIAGTVIAFGGLLFVAHTLQATREQIQLSRQALDADFRPWVSVDASLKKSVAFDQDKAVVEIVFNTKNHGRGPAKNMWIEAEISWEAMPSDAMERQFAELWTSARQKMKWWGTTIFPDKTHKEEWAFHINRNDIPTGRHIPILLGAVFYQAPGDESLRHTEFLCIINIEKGQPFIDWPSEPKVYTDVWLGELPYRPRVT